MVKQEVIKILLFRSEMKKQCEQGAANGKNPISIIAPCHRVIGAGGALVGFAGGLDKKDILLRLEQK
jgi:O-6-methylguanine DNA methyltransferase